MIAETTMHPESNTIFISLHGFAELEITKLAVDEFEKSLPTMPVHQMSLIIDYNDLVPFRQEILPILERCYAVVSLYMVMAQYFRQIGNWHSNYHLHIHDKLLAFYLKDQTQ